MTRSFKDHYLILIPSIYYVPQQPPCVVIGSNPSLYHILTPVFSL